MTWKNRFVTLFTLLSVLLTGCGVGVKYSFTGTTTEATTIAVKEFYNNADLGPANMGQVFTNTLKNYFLQNSSLKIAGETAELQVEGEISDFRVSPIAPVNSSDNSGVTKASSSRLTITLKVTFVNTLDENLSFNNRTFSFYQDFTNDQNLADVEEELSRKIFERIANDIFNASVANW